MEALRALAASLPAGFPGHVLVVMHLPPGARSALPLILDRAGPLRAVVARHGTRLVPGTIYVAPPDRHLLLATDHLVLSRGPTENGHRPAINALFRSAAVAAGPRTIGVVLTGVLDDGAAGLQAIAARGGVAVVQDPADALYAGMPEAALRLTAADHVLPATEMGDLLDKLVRQEVDPASAPPLTATLELEDRIARDGSSIDVHNPGDRGDMSGYTCPDCQGALIEIAPDANHYRCRVGHAWSAESLLAAQVDELERALWTALRSLDEKTGLARRMQADAHERGHELLVERYRRSAEESSIAAEVLRRYLISLNPPLDEELVP
ncbi:two-component system, chemotaxis family, response regulator CheB [Amycolatopsis xylanica]|uniref:protein-glutamate methylesterase n=1 Tax=Amycolatopsis xylanica TaxID=589385 RepID=A0A1H2UHT2_9PSEU|nr:two-component system, chemotaxis family, response regulator CheB [Amycolatopsis xylanica]